jgi:hypothetical protein
MKTNYKENVEENYLTTDISMLAYISKLEKGIDMRDILIAVLLSLCFLFFIGGILAGKNSKQTEIENRAKEIKTETITQQQLELLIFNEVQL